MKIDIIEFNTPTQLKEEIKRHFNEYIDKYFDTKELYTHHYLYLQFQIRAPIDRFGRFMDTAFLIQTGNNTYVID